MYRTLHIKNFRLFKDLALDGFKRVNLIAGKNNVGKTSLLEALFLLCSPYSPETTIKLYNLRGFATLKIEMPGGPETPWDNLFHDFEISAPVEISGSDPTSGEEKIKIKVIATPEELAQVSKNIQLPFANLIMTTNPASSAVAGPAGIMLELTQHISGKQQSVRYMVMGQDGIRVFPPSAPANFPCKYLTAKNFSPLHVDAVYFGTLEKENLQEFVVTSLQTVEPRLKRLATVVTDGVPVIHGDIGLKRLVPLPMMGDGMTRLASHVLAIGTARKGLVLIDEIENGLHHSILTKVWNVLAEAAKKFNVQVFATTHSFECISAAHRAFSSRGQYDFTLHRLERRADAIKSAAYDQESLGAAIENGFEVR